MRLFLAGFLLGVMLGNVWGTSEWATTVSDAIVTAIIIFMAASGIWDNSYFDDDYEDDDDDEGDGPSIEVPVASKP